ncbi:MAG: imidazole glycerol phosphate synthase subunit HisH [Rhodanobacteraceae bacterium]|jgi:glutamine amidotransferase|nr:imidazole glycerol phosphate synthase subunit HisH [Rhodanobacteraceae bacterium]MBL0041794.1 imidazole glycerol phosphate synthase subunit HisH [Xanthomonadales bacterium]MBP6078998.1 imidazole glycerol phosphate synthase subunit HisH [Xanthomonadales bacterium]MBP7623120.1 imidazole glycerol phosphate synthase subunit HisH [Xanthomonadales bacterium]
MLDSGGTNLGSVQYAFERLGVRAELSRDVDRIRRASHVVLPGVGAAAPGMQRLREAGLDRLIPTLTQPVLGVCLGMQLLFDASAEGDTTCLGILRGKLSRFDGARCGRVPHMGWNRVDTIKPSPLLAGLERDAFAYFVHSYAAPVTAATVASCDYGGAFAAVVSERNFHGAQFHPERSAAVGARLLANFLELQ